MTLLEELFRTGRIVDAILILVIAEALLLMLVWQRTGQGVRPSALVANLASGASLLLATRLAIADASWMLIALCLTLSFAAHVADLAGRWQS
jgi:hypothetical protein